MSNERLDNLIVEVSRRMQFNLEAYGTVWTGENDDTRFIVQPLLDEIERLRREIGGLIRERGQLAAEVDRVRDARSEDAGWVQTRHGRARAIIGEPFGPGVDPAGPSYTASDAERLRAEAAACSSQGEDHEAGEPPKSALHEAVDKARSIDPIAFIDAYNELARVRDAREET